METLKPIFMKNVKFWKLIFLSFILKGVFKTLQKQPTRGVPIKRCAGNLQENTHDEMRFQLSCKASTIKLMQVKQINLFKVRPMPC